MLNIENICRLAPMIPVLTINDVDKAVPLAQALFEGGLPVLEITLRTENALKAIESIASACPEVIIGVGTIKNKDDVQDALSAGATFGVSPGTTKSLIETIQAENLPFLPGCATPTEALELHAAGFNVVKFFPAEAAGGVAMLKSLLAPLSMLSFCPTGGISLHNVNQYLALPNVITVGGSWVSPQALIDANDWQGILALARKTTAVINP